jgi:hypothetical protein
MEGWKEYAGNAAKSTIFQDTETLIVIAWLALIIGKYKLEGLFGKYSGRQGISSSKLF